MKEVSSVKVLSGLISDNQIKPTLSKRQRSYIIESITHKELLEKYKLEGWEVLKEYKTRIKLKKPKSHDLYFEDQIWSLMAQLGFPTLNKDRHFKIPYSEDLQLSQQVDVFARDSETIIIIECKSTDKEIKKGNFKEVIEAIGGKKEGILKSLKKLYPDTKFKVRFIFATNNYYLSDPDKERLNNFDILHFTEDTLKYYQGLTKHLGTAAKYQFLGNIFADKSIPELANQVPAIQGKMGGHTYYSFSIEPEKLLKMGYILHRNKANEKLEPTYQRLIKKHRLLSINQFIENRGFFPNSIVININTDRALRFDQATPQVNDSISRIGILHLPKFYCAAFII